MKIACNMYTATTRIQSEFVIDQLSIVSMPLMKYMAMAKERELKKIQDSTDVDVDVE